MSDAEADEAFIRVSAISLEDGGSGDVPDPLAEDPPISTFTADGGLAPSSRELVRLPASRARRSLMPAAAVSEPPDL
jgi:hypothetical protein